MAVSRFPVSNSDRAVDRSLLLQNDDSETLAVIPAAEDLLSDAERDLIITSEPLQAESRLSLVPPNVIIGTRRNDVLRGTDQPDRIEGRGGNDRLFGEGADDELFGDADDDRLFGGRGNDVLSGNDGRDRLFGEKGDDQLFGSQGPDDLRGQDGNDLLRGGGSRDELLGGTGNDRLFGEGARDLLLGGRGDDILVGGPERDRMGGGGGDNRFVYNSFNDRGDTIVDFDRRRDVLDLSRLFRGDNFPSSDPFERYVIIVREDEDVTIIRVDADGNSGDEPFKTLVTLENVEFDDIGRRNFVF